MIQRLGFARNWEPRTRQIATIAFTVVVVLGLWALTAKIWPESAPLGVIILGVIFGTATGLLAIGLVLIYRANTIINFSYAAMGAVGGVLMVNLYLEQKWPYYLTLAIGVATGLLLGGLIEFTVVRRFANASRLILTVATIGLAQLLGGVSALIPTIWDSPGLVGGFKTPVSFSFEISPIKITGDHLLIIFCVAPILIALAWFLLRTDVGIAVRAAADNAERALLYGIPIRRLQTIVWVGVRRTRVADLHLEGPLRRRRIDGLRKHRVPAATRLGGRRHRKDGIATDSLPGRNRIWKSLRRSCSGTRARRPPLTSPSSSSSCSACSSSGNASPGLPKGPEPGV